MAMEYGADTGAGCAVLIARKVTSLKMTRMQPGLDQDAGEKPQRRRNSTKQIVGLCGTRIVRTDKPVRITVRADLAIRLRRFAMEVVDGATVSTHWPVRKSWPLNISGICSLSPNLRPSEYQNPSVLAALQLKGWSLCPLR
jgi:hypothetical protein